jgi:hypothetical protein
MLTYHRIIIGSVIIPCYCNSYSVHEPSPPPLVEVSLVSVGGYTVASGGGSNGHARDRCRTVEGRRGHLVLLQAQAPVVPDGGAADERAEGGQVEAPARLGNNQGTFGELSGNNQGTFRGHSGDNAAVLGVPLGLLDV